MEVIEKQKKDARITIRFSRPEMDILNSKITEAGYKSAGAFIRDYVAHGKVKPKVGVEVVQIARELMNLASLINAERPNSELLEKVKHIAHINMGGAA
ncbi:plasmid mobilization protein [Pseudomonas frederiksbergensis]|uniref:Mobilization protein n=1 Tax=Pseudomonas frederiksbergensis TaxID=104087 RepID=A0A423HRB0_9PSED|nr:hypothetical protein [Pseudomonas frederiksbergensis]RON15608.1 hypothetical protein BK662_12755 [Pseudomonas frederiksbergensis]